MIRTAAILFILIVLPAQATAGDPVELLIQGIEGDALENVKKTLALPYGLVLNGEVNTFWLERFRREIPDRVQQALEPYGYYRPQVQSDLEKTAEGGYRIRVQIAPGIPVRITAARVAVRGPGSGEEQLKKLVDAFPLHGGDVLLQTHYEEAKSRLKSRAIELGYLDADFSSHAIAVDPEKSAARIDLVMETGPRYRFGEVGFEGAPDYPDQFLRRYLTFKPGDVFSHAKLGESQLNLINSDRFKEVFPIAEKEKAQGEFVPVVMRVREAPSKRLRPGIGYGTDIGPRFSLQYRDLNEFDRGQEFHTELNLSAKLQSLNSEYRLPGTRDINSYTGLQFNLRREDVAAYTNENVSAEINRTRSFRRGRIGTIYLRFEREHSTVGLQAVDARLVLPGVRFSERRYDDLLRPAQGHYFTIDIRGTHQAIGSNTRFIQAITEGNLLVPLPWRLSLFTRAQVGVTFQNAPVSDLPVSYRFFAGGDRSVRGYSYQSLGPVDAFGRVTGGRDLLVGSVELDRALFTNWAVAAFYDAGNAFNSFDSIRLHQGAGIGVRYYTVVGALRLDLARQIAVPSPSYRVHFTVGFAF